MLGEVDGEVAPFTSLSHVPPPVILDTRARPVGAAFSGHCLLPHDTAGAASCRALSRRHWRSNVLKRQRRVRRGGEQGEVAAWDEQSRVQHPEAEVVSRGGWCRGRGGSRRE